MSGLFSSEGRIPRSTYWKFVICFWIISAILGALEEYLHVPAFIVGAASLLIIVVAIIVQIKRWHDRDKSGWWVLISFVPCIGWIWALVECGFLKGTDGPNQYGPDPLQQ